MNQPSEPVTGALSPSSESSEAMFALLNAAHRLELRLEEALGAVGLSTAKFGLLARLAKADESVSLSELATRINCVRSNVTQLVDRLESDGLVRRVDDPSDRRSVRAELTVVGRERYVAGSEAFERVRSEFSASLGNSGCASLEQVLALLR